MDKNTVVIILLGIIIIILGVWYYNYNYTRPQELVRKLPMHTPLPALKDLRFVQGEIIDVSGKVLTVKINKLVGQTFSTAKVVSEEYKVTVGDKTELVKLTLPAKSSKVQSSSSSSSPVQLKPVKIALKDFKKGDQVSIYADKNLIEIKDFTAAKIKLLPK